MTGKHAWGICDRTGFRYPLKDLVWEYSDGTKTGLRVGRDVVDPDHPQNDVGRIRTDDPKPLKHPRPDPYVADNRKAITNNTAPVVTGTGTVGLQLNCSQGTWTGEVISYAYQWQRGGVDIDGARESVYTTVSADSGTSVSCIVTTTNPYGTTTSATSNTVAVS